MSVKLLEKEICLHLLCQQKFHSEIRDGHGDCKICEYDPINNKKCSRYTPIRLRQYEVNER